MSGPIWLPFIFAAIFILLVFMRTGSLNAFFGKDPDFSRILQEQGHFESKNNLNQPYIFVNEKGNKIILECFPRERANDCIKHFPHIMENVYIKYAKLKPGWPHSVDGIIISVENDRSNFLSEQERMASLNKDDLPLILKILVILIDIFGIIMPLTLITFILGTGVFISLKRTFGESR